MTSHPSRSFPIFLKLSLIFVLLTACSARQSTPQVEATPTSNPVATNPVEPATATLTEEATLPVATDTPTVATLPAETTPTPEEASTPEALVFAVIGDYGLAGAEEAAVAALVQSWNPELIITTGDNNYPSGGADTIDTNIGQYYSNFISSYTGTYGPGSDVNRFFPSPGNHDWDTPGLLPYLDYFTLPGNERYYDFTWGPVHFFSLDSDSREPDGVNASSVQAQWFQEMVANSTSPWQIAYMHHAPYSSGYHGSIDWARWPYAEWGADAVISGHDHVYERLQIDEIPYFVNGLGGSPNRYGFENILPESQFRYRDTQGAMRVTATETTLTFEFININGEVIDFITLTQSSEEGAVVESAPTAEAGPPPNAVTFPDPASFSWQSVGTGYISPILVTHAHDGSNRLFVVEQAGVIRIIGQETPFLNIHNRVGDEGNEQGLLGLVFHPEHDENGFFYINYTNNSGDTVISRFQVSADDPNRANPDSETILLQVAQPYANHNGGHLAFGPDGYLYIALGDGGSGGDPNGNGQGMDTLLGKLLRIDVNADTYVVPADNPFVSGGGLPEIWALGLRNPWRFSFDRQTGDVYIADVGQGQWEEVDFLPAGSAGGANFGWNYFEGSHAFEGSPPSGVSLIAPVWEYTHVGSTCSVTGGYVYRGLDLPEWTGIYLYGDFCSGQVWGLLRDSNGNWQNQLLFEMGISITSFGEDEAGEVYVVARQGEIYKLIRR